MTLNNTNDGVIKIKIILVIIYCGLFVLSIVVVDGSLASNLQELLLQVGKAISSLPPSQATP